MKILLDESLPRKLFRDFGPDHEVRTVRGMGWLGQRNGALMRLIVENYFEALVTLDLKRTFAQTDALMPGGGLWVENANNSVKTFVW